MGRKRDKFEDNSSKITIWQEPFSQSKGPFAEKFQEWYKKEAKQKDDKDKEKLRKYAGICAGLVAKWIEYSAGFGYKEGKPDPISDRDNRGAFWTWLAPEGSKEDKEKPKKKLNPGAVSTVIELHQADMTSKVIAAGDGRTEYALFKKNVGLELEKPLSGTQKNQEGKSPLEYVLLELDSIKKDTPSIYWLYLTSTTKTGSPSHAMGGIVRIVGNNTKINFFDPNVGEYVFADEYKFNNWSKLHEKYKQYEKLLGGPVITDWFKRG